MQDYFTDYFVKIVLTQKTKTGLAQIGVNIIMGGFFIYGDWKG